MRTLRLRLSALLRRRRLDGELDEEIQAHLAMQEEEFRRAGMSAQAARLAALRAFGGVARAAEAYRERRGVPWLESAGRDVRYALRGLRRSPGFTAAAVLSLALGIGANTAVFSLFHTLILRMLPVRDPAALLSVYKTGGWGKGITSYPVYLTLRRRKDLFQDVAARTGVQKVRFQAAGGAGVELVNRELVSGNYFALLGIRPGLGRLFNDRDNRVPQGHPLVVLSYEFWRNRFGGDPDILGRTLTVDEQPLTVVGVAAAGFRGIEVERRADLWVPLMMSRQQVLDDNINWVWVIARRAAGVSRPHIQSAVDAVMARYLAARYGTNGNAAFRRIAMEQRLQVRDGSAGISLLREEFSLPLTVLMLAVGLVLLVACTNLANLLLARGAARRKEVALRYSLGATRGRLVRQAFTESMLLALAGCLNGAVFALWGQPYMLHFLPPGSTEPFSARPDGAVLAFTLAVSMLSAILFGLAPALRSTAIDPAAGLQAQGAAASGHRPVLRRVLVIAQVAFSVVLAVLAGLFGHSLSQLRGVDSGLGSRNTIAFQLDFPRSWETARVWTARDRFLAQAEAMPGVVAASFAFPGPFRSGSGFISIRVPGSDRTFHEPADVEIQYVGPRHFETIGTRPILGRDIGPGDTGASRKAVVVNEAFVRAFLPGEPNPLSRVVSFDDSKPGGEPTLITGVVPNVTHYGLREGVKPTLYVPYAQMQPLFPFPPMILVRARVPASALLPLLRREARNIGPQVALTEPRTIGQQIEDSIYQDRLLATLSGFFGALALLLAAIGLYGVVAYTTARRSAEIGIRIALGARRPAVLWMVLRDALVLVVIGLCLGLPAALAAARAVGAVLFEVKPADPATFVLTACVLSAIALAAAFLPARRAASLQPLNVLRHD